MNVEQFLDLGKGSYVRALDTKETGCVDSVDYDAMVATVTFKDGDRHLAADEMYYLGTPGLDAPYLTDLSDDWW